MRPALWKWIILSLLVLTSCRLIRSEQATPAPEQEDPAATSVAQTPPEARSAIARADKEGDGGQAVSAIATPHPTLEPMPTPDPAGDRWVILLYVSADNELTPSSLQALNEMEAVGPPAESGVIVQIDGPIRESGLDETGARALRYYLGGDDDPQRLNSTLEANLGPVNMGDPQTLTDFVVWGVERFPAQHYALIIRGPGGGWRGLAYDGGEGDDLSMPDLQGALQRALQQLGRPRLDVIGLDAPLSGQLEVLEAIQPYANYAVASPGLHSQSAWNYDELLADLDERPEQDAASLAQAMARSVGDNDARVPATDPGAMVVDLRRLPQVTAAVASLVDLTEDRLPLVASGVARARQAARSYGDLFPRESDYHAALDLGHFAALLAEESPLIDVARASQALAESVADSLVMPQAGSETWPQGTISVYFPAGQQAHDGAYEAVTTSPWPIFLQRYYEAAREVSLAPRLSVAALTGETAGVQQPSHLSLEVAGLDIARVAVATLRQDGAGPGRLLAYDPLPSTEAAEVESPAAQAWGDGVHRRSHVWNTTAAYVGDGANGDFVLLQPAGPEDALYAAGGRYLPAGGSGPREATLLFDSETKQLVAVWGLQGETQRHTPDRLLPEAGDEFQLYQAFMDEEWSVSYEPGVTLVFTTGNEITYDRFPLPGGDYQVGFVAETSLGQKAGTLVDIAVDNEDLTPGFQAYLDPNLGFQFQYPVLWPAPAYNGDVLVTGDPEREMQLTVTVQQGMATGTAADLKARALQAFGQVHGLYDENVVVAGQNGLLTAYGYQGEGGPRTGLLLTFLNDERDLGFVVDVDGPAQAEEDAIGLADRLIESWQFRPIASDTGQEKWQRLEIGDLTVPVPAGYGHQTLENGWELFKRDDHFVALRLDPLQRGGRPQIVAHWLEVAARGVEGFAAEEPTQVALAGKVWSRTDFGYVADEGAMKGFLMATIVNGEEVVAWAEAPAAVYEERVGNPFTLLVAGAVAPLEGQSGLLYEATFDELAGWGAGDREGAAAEVGGGAYELTVTAQRGFFWATAGQSFGDAVYELQATQMAGPLDNGYGMILRAGDDAAGFYVFAISGDGYAWVGRCEDGCAGATTLHGEGWFRSAAVNQGLETANRLRVEALGPEMVFTVNGVEVARLQDGALAAGDVGFFVETLGEGGVRVRFDELRVISW